MVINDNNTDVSCSLLLRSLSRLHIVKYVIYRLLHIFGPLIRITGFVV